MSKKNSKSRANKIYRTPPTPEPEELREKEKSFVIDSVAVNTISVDYSKANPKVGKVIPPYNAQRDKHVQNYFGYTGVPRTLRVTGQRTPEDTSIDGRIMDRFHKAGAGYIYCQLRNQFGAGHSREQTDGHAQFMRGIKGVIGYNGPFGFRRNNPWLRKTPSPFGPYRSPTW